MLQWTQFLTYLSYSLTGLNMSATPFIQFSTKANHFH